MLDDDRTAYVTPEMIAKTHGVDLDECMIANINHSKDLYDGLYKLYAGIEIKEVP